MTSRTDFKLENIGKEKTAETSRSSVPNRLKFTDFNISNDKSLTGRELLTSDELMKFNFGEGLFMRTRINSIKSILPIIDNYKINILKKEVIYPILSRNKIELFNLDSYRIEKKFLEDLGEIDKIERERNKIYLTKKKLETLMFF